MHQYNPSRRLSRSSRRNKIGVGGSEKKGSACHVFGRTLASQWGGGHRSLAHFPSTKAIVELSSDHPRRQPIHPNPEWAGLFG